MTILEIVLLILGILVFVGSFIIPESKNDMEEVDKEFTKEQIQEIIKDEVKDMRGLVEDTVEETVSYSMERTERALERISNEKMTAISEYSETVLTDIHKSHEEVLFLYDMLNDKHENIKETATEVTRTVKEVNQVVQEAVQEADYVKKEVSQATQQVMDDSFKPMDVSGIEKLQYKEKGNEVKTKTEKQKKKSEARDVSLQFDMAQETADNNNDRILELHKNGKSNVAIAKELGLGVGEVKLVIDLFKGM